MSATIALRRPVPPHRTSSNIDPLPSLPISVEHMHTICPVPVAAVPNRHIPVCPPGPAPHDTPNTPPPSPGKDDEQTQKSLLYPALADKYPPLHSGPLTLYRIDERELAAALDFASRQPLPSPSSVFPWLHGLHRDNQIQRNFFLARRRGLAKTPSCLRGITLVKADGDMTASRLKGAIPAHEFLRFDAAEFLDVDPQHGFSVRNFQIQSAKTATISDIVVYGLDDVAVRQLAWDIATAQRKWREARDGRIPALPIHNTFVCIGPFWTFEDNHPELVVLDSAGQWTGNALNLPIQEKEEMLAITRASEISHNVWLGSSPNMPKGEYHHDVVISCTDSSRPNPGAFRAVAEGADESRVTFLEFPSSGSILAPTWSQADADAILETCKWIHHLAHGTRPSATETTKRAADRTGMVEKKTEAEAADGTYGSKARPRKILIHCDDGYTESSMLAIAYYTFSTGRPYHDAWLRLHTEEKRNFFAYPSDVALIKAIGTRLLRESPACADKSLADITDIMQDEPAWLAGFDGSLPSRITDYMYLGNLRHANNPHLLRAVGIGQVLSVGETVRWRDEELDRWGAENMCIIQDVQDNGIDPLMDEFDTCLEFIDRGRRNKTATLVHCRVGVSRSATICIAEVMRAFNTSLPRAYCYVRARRLNVIIQPHLRFAYELLKWEEVLQTRRTDEPGNSDSTFKREMEWGELAREIALLNKPYTK